VAEERGWKMFFPEIEKHKKLNFVNKKKPKRLEKEFI
jgi:hypothetical protein